MRWTQLVILSLWLVLHVDGSPRLKRDACEKAQLDFNKCTYKAYEDYSKAFTAGDDGRPDWFARKSCNYLTASVEDCGNLLIGPCNTKEDVTALKDEQLKSILPQIKTSISEWDSDKCPAVKAHMDRLKGDCTKNKADFNKCTKKAYDNYKNAHTAGDDGKPDWLARKSCNYIVEAVEDCGNAMIGECETKEKVTVMKDEQIKGILAQLKTSIAEWDSDKCPAVKAHVERMKAAEGIRNDAMDGEDRTDTALAVSAYLFEVLSMIVQ